MDLLGDRLNEQFDAMWLDQFEIDQILADG